MNTNGATCAWCAQERGDFAPGTTHGICERHRAMLLQQYERERRFYVRWHPAKRRESIEFSAAVLVGAALLGVAILAMFAL